MASRRVFRRWQILALCLLLLSLTMRKKAFKQSNNTSRTLLKQLEHAQKNDCRDIGFFQEEVGSGEVGHLGHLGYSRRGLSRGLGQPTKKKFLVSRICYCCQASSCCATFQLVTDGYLRIILSNDVSPNPGPVQCPCSVCARAVATSHPAIQCDVCKKWCHIGPKCGNVPPKIYHELINKEYFNWNFPVCKDYHLRYDHERTVDQHSNRPSPDAGARPQS